MMKKLEKLHNKKIEFTNKIKGGNTIALQESDLADSTTTAHQPTQTSGHISCDHRVDIKQGGTIVYY